MVGVWYIKFRIERVLIGPAPVQETGRAGRDGEPSFSVLYVGHADLEWCARICKGSEKAKFEGMVTYATENRCRRAHLLSYFGEKNGSCKQALDEACDVCQNGRDVRARQVSAEQHRVELVRYDLSELATVQI
jgi:ATP-dependent DNA helicase RecQ